MWLRVSSCASTLRLSSSRRSSCSLTSSVQTPTPPPSSGWAVTWKARRLPATVAQRTVSRRWPRLAASLARASAERSKATPRAAASSRLAASTAFSQAALTQTGEPSAAAIQAGVARALRKAAKRGRGRQAGVLGRPPPRGAARPWRRPRGPPRRPAPPSPLHLEGAGLAAFEQGAQAPRMVGVGAHQGVDHALRIGLGQAQGLGADRQATPRPRPAGRGRPPRPAGRNRRLRRRPGRRRRGPRCRPAARRSRPRAACAWRRWASAQSTAQIARLTAPAAAARISWWLLIPAFGRRSGESPRSHTKPRRDLAASAPTVGPR